MTSHIFNTNSLGQNSFPKLVLMFFVRFFPGVLQGSKIWQQKNPVTVFFVSRSQKVHGSSGAFPIPSGDRLVIQDGKVLDGCRSRYLVAPWYLATTWVYPSPSNSTRSISFLSKGTSIKTFIAVTGWEVDTDNEFVRWAVSPDFTGLILVKTQLITSY